MKKLIPLITAFITLALTSCLSTGGAASSHTVELPEDPVTAAHKIVAYEKEGTYLYTFKAVNWGDAVCEVKIYDDKYMKVTYPQSETPLYYYYKFYGDYLDGSKRIGVFGMAVGITVAEVDEIVFRLPIIGGYKFKSLADNAKNNKRYLSGEITHNTYPAAKQPDVWHFLEFFESLDKQFVSVTDEVGNKKDIAKTLYCALTEKTGWTATWSENKESTVMGETNETNAL
ncbi:MAG: hypothetical protein IJR39_07090 [Treponema sp.]|nr:hypothetical protein [Treponema sp.]MBQ9623083.1 hypothetical protein [Treponema sp.]